jgi:hypothetical protein
VFDHWEFNDNSFDCRKGEDWLSLGVDGDEGIQEFPVKFLLKMGISGYIQLQMTTMGKIKKWFMKCPCREQDDEWVPKLGFLFLAEDPAAFADIIANGANEREKRKLGFDFAFILNRFQ